MNRRNDLDRSFMRSHTEASNRSDSRSQGAQSRILYDRDIQKRAEKLAQQQIDWRIKSSILSSSDSKRKQKDQQLSTSSLIKHRQQETQGLCQRLKTEVVSNQRMEQEQNVLKNFYQNLSNKPFNELQRPKCNNLMLKYHERILKQELKAIDPNAFLIRQEEEEGQNKRKRLFSLQISDPKSMNAISVLYQIKNPTCASSQQNQNKEPTNGVDSNLNSVQNFYKNARKVSYQKILNRLVNCQTEEKSKKLSDITFLTEHSKAKNKSHKLGFFDPSVNKFDSQKRASKQKVPYRLSQTETAVLQQESDESFDSEDSIEVIDGLEYESGLHIRSPSEFYQPLFQSKKSRKAINNPKKTASTVPVSISGSAASPQPQLLAEPKKEEEKFAFENRIQAKYKKVHTYIQQKHKEAEERRKPKLFQIYHAQTVSAAFASDPISIPKSPAKPLNQQEGVSQADTQTIYSTITASNQNGEQQQEGEKVGLAALLNPNAKLDEFKNKLKKAADQDQEEKKIQNGHIHPNIMKRYKHIFNSKEHKHSSRLQVLRQYSVNVNQQDNFQTRDAGVEATRRLYAEQIIDFILTKMPAEHELFEISRDQRKEIRKQKDKLISYKNMPNLPLDIIQSTINNFEAGFTLDQIVPSKKTALLIELYNLYKKTDPPQPQVDTETYEQSEKLATETTQQTEQMQSIESGLNVSTRFSTKKPSEYIRLNQINNAGSNSIQKIIE